MLNAVSPENQEHIYTLIGRHLRPCGAGVSRICLRRGLDRLHAVADLDAFAVRIRNRRQRFRGSRGVLLRRSGADGGRGLLSRNPILERRSWPELRTPPRQRPRAGIAEPGMGSAGVFRRLADDYGEVKCEFLGRATLHENIVVASVPTAVLPLLEEAPSIRIRETMQDIAAGTVFFGAIFIAARTRVRANPRASCPGRGRDRYAVVRTTI